MPPANTCSLITHLWYLCLYQRINNISASQLRTANLVQAVESYRLWPEGPGFESRSPRIAQARVKLATDTLPRTPYRAGALCTGYALYVNMSSLFHYFLEVCKYVISVSLLILTCWLLSPYRWLDSGLSFFICQFFCCIGWERKVF